MPTYLGFDVLEIEPSRAGPLAEGIARAHGVLDSSTGERWTDPLEDSAVADAPFLWPCFTRAEARTQRAWLDARKGQVVPFWAPTWEADLTLAYDSAAGSETLIIELIRYAELMWPGSNGRRHLAVYPHGGSASYHYVTAAGLTRSGQTEMLTITPALPAECLVGATRIAFLRFCRLAAPFVDRIWSGGHYCEAKIPFVEIPMEAPAA